MKQFPVLFTRIIIILSLFFVVLPATPVHAASIVVTNSNDSGAGSLRQAISDAADGTTISFNDDYTITLKSLISISKNLAIIGGEHNVTISGGGTTGMFAVSGSSVTFSLDHLTLTNGAADATACEGQANFCGGVVSVGNGASLSISNSTLSNNKANNGALNGDGGAIYSFFGNLSISNSTFNDNYSTSGGAIWQSCGTLNIKNSTFYNNSANGYGGAIVMIVGYFPSSLTLKNNTFAGNSAVGSNGGALEIVGTNSGFTLSATNNIIANSPGGGNCKTFQSLNSSNLTDDSTCGATVSSSILLGSLGNYGGETQTIPLLPGSSAINAGTTDASVTTDQRGVSRAQLSAYDVGAFESQGFSLVADSGDNQGAVFSSAFAQPLVAKVTAINSLEPVAGGKVTFTSPLSGASAGLGSSSTPVASNSLSATIDSSGFATAYATANAISGSYSITAAISKPVLNTAFNLANGLPLTVTINQSGSSDPTKTNPINFDVVFSRAVTDFKSSNITLSGTASDAVISGITGSDADYVVSVTGISSGTVTATIPAGAVSDSVGIKNYVSTSTDNTVTYDGTAPETTISTTPGNPVNTTDASISFSGTDDTNGSGIAGYQCKLDSGAYASCTSPKDYSGLSEGSHTFTVYASDTIGNDDLSPATYTWVVDTSSPSTSITAKPSDPSASSSASFSFSGDDGSGSGIAGYKCKLDGGDYEDCTSPKDYSSLADGSHTFMVFAADLAGNGETPVSYTWVVDTSAPSTSITAKPSDPSTSSSASFSFSGNDGSGTGVAGYQCKLDSGDYAGCTSPKTYSGLSDGSHTFMVYAVDAAGNSDSSPDSSTWWIDTINPTLTMTSTVSDTTNVSPIPVTVTSSESLIGFSVEDIIVSNGTASNFITVDSKTYTFDLNPAGQGVVTANIPSGAGVDTANLPSTAAHLSRTYDSVRPAVTIDQAAGQNDPTSSSSVLFTVVFSENVTGFSTSDVTISGTASGASVTDISGSGSTYTVTVSGMTATGTVIASIDAGLVTDSAVNSNQASTSTDNSVSYILSATAATKDATEISSSTAVLNGTINSLGEDAAVTFEFGLDGAADTTIVSADPATVPGTTSTDVDVKYSLTNLKSNTTYRFRVIATNVVGSTYGDYQKFTTLDANIKLDIHDTTHAPVTFAAINDNLHAFATVNGKGSTNISSGSVIFYSYPNLVCSGVSWSEETVALGGSGTADMSSTVPLLANGLSFKAHYSGDSNYPATDSECTAISTSQYPTLLTLSSNNTPAEGASLEGSTSQIKLQFNMDLLHDSDSDGNSVTNPGNYLLVEQGQNAAIDTQSCALGVAGDDIKIKVNSVNFDSTTYLATLNVNDGTQLPIGVYRIYVCGTTSISNLDKIVYLNNHLADSSLNFSIASITINSSTSAVSSLPQINTGFAPDIKTVLGKQPSEKAYAEKNIWIEIPALEIKEDVVGVPQSKQGWDVSWLGDKIGYLEGTTYPTWPGNSILTGHVSNTNGLPGVFANLGTLNWGKQIIIHASGQKYTYEVRSVNTIAAKDLSSVITKQDKYTWLTLITCKGYDEKSGTYPWRTVVRAILVSVKDE